MADDLSGLLLGQPVVHRSVQMIRDLLARDQNGDRDDAPVARRQAWALPEIAEYDAFCIFFKGGRDGANVFGRGHGFYSFGGCLLAAGRAGDDRQRKQGCCEYSHCGCPPMVAGCAMSHDATSAAQSTVMALTRNT